MNRFWADFRFAARLLLKNPGFTAVALLALMLGIGASTALFSVVNAVLLNPIPYPESDRICYLSESGSEQREPRLLVSYPNFLDWKERNTTFEVLAAYRFATYNLTGAESPQQVRVVHVSPDFFRVIQVAPAAGNPFPPEAHSGKGEKAVLLTHRLWQNQFGGDRDLVGKAVQMDGQGWRVAGILPEGFRFPYEDPWDMLAPLGDPSGLSLQRGHRELQVLGLLAEGSGLQEARTEFDAIARRLEEEYPEENEGMGVRVVSLQSKIVGDVRPTFHLLLAAVGLLLLIACANIANLLLARSRRRAREIGVRLALGAGRGRLMRQWLTESLLLSLAGGLLGVLAAFWLLEALLALAPARVPRLDEIAIDWQALLFTGGITLLTGLLFGLAPALQSSRTDIRLALSAASRGAGIDPRERRWRQGFVAAQAALAVVLLIGAGLILRSLDSLTGIDPGFEGNVLTMGLFLPPNDYPQAESRAAYFRQALEKLEALPNVASAGAGNYLPTLSPNMPVEVSAKRSPDVEHTLGQRVVTEGYFETLRVPIVRGRAFNRSDTGQARRVAVINEAAARRLFPDGSPVGQSVQMSLARGEPVELQVVGVVESMRHFGLQSPPVPEIFLPYEQSAWSYMNMVVRPERGDAMALAPAVREALWEIDPRRPFFATYTLGRAVERASVSIPRFRALLLSAFALVAAVLAGTGLYGVVSYSVNTRRREFGTRMALGANTADIVAMVLRQGVATALAGMAAGVALALAAARSISGLLFQISPFDPVTFAAVPAVLLAVAVLSVWVPARRASRVDPAQSLRAE